MIITQHTATKPKRTKFQKASLTKRNKNTNLPAVPPSRLVLGRVVSLAVVVLDVHPIVSVPVKVKHCVECYSGAHQMHETLLIKPRALDRDTHSSLSR